MRAREQWRALPKRLRTAVIESLEESAQLFDVPLHDVSKPGWPVLEAAKPEVATAFRVAVAVLDAAGRKKGT